MDVVTKLYHTKKMSFHSPPEINARLASGVYNVICIIVRSSADFKIMFLRIETHWDIKYLTRTGEEGGIKFQVSILYSVSIT